MPPPLKWAGSTTSMDGRLMVAVNEIIELNLQPNESLGLRVSGGTDTVDEGEDPGLFVEEILEGAASRDGRMQVDDKIIEVNGTALGERTHEEYMGILTQAVGSLQVVLLVTRLRDVASVSWEEFFAGRYGHVASNGRYAQGSIDYVSEGFAVVELEQMEAQGFGLALAGAKSQEEAGVAIGVYIAAIFAGGPAARGAIEGTLSRGMQIVEINGWNCIRATVEEVELLLNRFARATIVVKENPEGFLPFSDESLSRYYAPLKVEGAAPTLESLRQVNLPFDPTGNTKLGLRIIGVPPNTKFDATGVFVNGCAENSVAAERLSVGDQIIEINGCTLAGATHDVAADTLRSSKGTAKLLVVHNEPGYAYMTDMVDKHEEELQADPQARRYVKDRLFPDTRVPQVETLRPVDPNVRTTVRLPRPVNQPFGVTIHVREVAGRKLPLITAISAGSVAAEAANLRVGQQVYALNNTVLSEDTPHRDIETVLSDPTTEYLEIVASVEPVIDVNELLANLLLTRTSTAISHQLVRLVRVPDNINGLGFMCVGPTEDPGLQPFGIFVCRTSLPQLEQGDQILAVSSANHGKFECLFDCSHKKAMALLMRAKMARETYLVVCSNPEAYAFFSVVNQHKPDLRQLLPEPLTPQGIAAAHSLPQQQQQQQQHQEKDEGVPAGDGDQKQQLGQPVPQTSDADQAGTPAAANGEAREGADDKQAAAASSSAASPAKSGNHSFTAPPARSSFFSLSEPPFHVRALFEWQPQGEDQLGFADRDVLRVDKLLSPEFWLATHVASGARGKIPTPDYYEEHFKTTQFWQQKKHIAQSIDATMKDADENTRREAREDALTVHSYEAVEWQELNGTMRPLAVFGMYAEQVIVEAIKHVEEVPITPPLRCTSRPMREGEVDGREYEFVSREEMERRLLNKELIEVGNFKGNLYGTTIESVANPAREGKLVLMQCHPPAIRRLELLGNVHPIVVFIAPSDKRLDGEDEVSRKAAWEQVEHSHCFTHVLREASSPDLAKQAADIVNKEGRSKGLWAAVPALLPRQQTSTASSPAKASAGASSHNTSAAAAITADTSVHEQTNGTATLDMYSQSTSLKCEFETVVVKRLGKHKYGFKLLADPETHVPTVSISSSIQYTKGKLYDGARVLCVERQNVVCESSSKLKDALKKNAETLSVVLFPRHLDVRGVKLKKRSNSYGLKLSASEAVPAVTIMTAPPSGVVREGVCRRGDSIVSISGAPMLDTSLDEVKSALQQRKSVKIALAEHDDLLLATSSTSRRIEMRRLGTGFGLDIEILEDLPVIVSIVPNSVASASGLRVGDVIFKINNMATRNASRENVLSSLRTSPTVTLVVDTSSRFQRREVVLQRAPGASYGMHIQTTAGFLPMVTKVVEGSPAATAGARSILPGDEIVQINDKDTEGKTHEEVIAMLSSADTVRLQLRHTLENDRMRPSVDSPPAFKMEAEDKDDTNVETTIGEDHQGAPASDAAAAAATREDTDQAPFTVDRVELDGLDNGRKISFHSPSAAQALGLSLGRSESLGRFVVQGVQPEGLAHECGAISTGDVIIELNGVRITTQKELQQALAGSSTTISLLVGTPAQQRVLLDTRHERLGLRLACMEGSYPIVSYVEEDGAAAKEPALVPGVTILKVNGQNMRNATSDVLRHALSASPLIELVLGERIAMEDEEQQQHRDTGADTGVDANPNPIRVARIRREPGKPLGLAVRTQENASLYPLVPNIIEGSLAEKEGTIQPNDEIVQINGHSAHGLEHDAVVQLLVQPADVVEIHVRKSMIKLGDAARAERHLRITKGEAGVGLSLITGEGAPALVLHVAPNSPAAACGDLQTGEVISELNGKPTADMTHKDVLEVFRRAPAVQLTLAPRQPGEVEVVTLQRSTSGLGLVIEWDDNDVGRIRRVVDGTPAAMAGVKAGAELMAVNNVAVIGAQHEDVLNLLKGEETTVMLRYPPTHDEAGAQGQARGVAEQQQQPVQSREEHGQRAEQSKRDEEQQQQQQHHQHEEETADQQGGTGETEEIPPPSYSSLQAHGQGEVRMVTVRRGPEGYGFRLATDQTKPSPPIIMEVMPNSPARGILNTADAIQTINGQDTTNLTHEDVLQVIGSSQELRLSVAHDAQGLLDLLASTREAERNQPLPGLSKGLVVVSMSRGGGSYGLRIETLQGERHFIVEVLPGGAALATGRVSAGQEIVAINGTEVRGSPHEAVVRLLANSNTVDLRLTTLPTLGDCHHVQLRRNEDNSLGLKLQVSQDGTPLSYPAISHVSDHNVGVVKPGDVIVRINGQSVAGLTLEQLAPTFMSNPLVLDVFREPTEEAPTQHQQQQKQAAVSTRGMEASASPAQQQEEKGQGEDEGQEKQGATSEGANVLSPPADNAPLIASQEAQSDLRTVILQRTHQGFGLQIASPGDSDTPLHQITLVLPSARIVSGSVGAGDVIHKINETEVTGLSHDEVVAMLSGQSMLEMVVRKSQSTEHMEPVEAFQRLMSGNGPYQGQGDQDESDEDEREPPTADEGQQEGERAPAETTSGDKQETSSQQQQQKAEREEDEEREGEQVPAEHADVDQGQTRSVQADEEGTEQTEATGGVTAPQPLNVETRVVHVAKNDGGLGMKFLGLGEGLGVLVTGIMPETPADACKDLNVYDTIHKINGQDVTHLEHDAVRDILVNASSFELEVSPAPSDRMAILVREDKEEPVGIDLVGDEQGRVRVLRVGDEAQFADIAVEQGDIIVEVNHRDVRHLSALQVSALLRSTSEVVTIAVNSCQDPLPEQETSA